MGGKKEKVPKLKDNKLTHLFFLALRKMGVSKDSKSQSQTLHLTGPQLWLLNAFKTVQTKYETNHSKPKKLITNITFHACNI